MTTNAMTLDEAREAYAIGARRSDHIRANTRQQHRWGYTPDPAAARQTDAMAALAEAWVAAATGRQWVSRDNTRPDDPLAGDVGGGLCVRWTRLEKGGLILHPDDHDSLIGVLVTGLAYPLTIVGWLPVVDGKHPSYWRTDVRHPCFIVPQYRLNPDMGALPPAP